MTAETLKALVLLLWLFFAAWCYLLVVYAVGIIWIFQKPKGKIYFSKRILTGVVSLMALNGILQIIVIWCQATKFHEIFAENDANTEYDALLAVLIIFSTIFTFAQQLCFYFLTNNLILQINSEQFSLIGLTVYFSSITEFGYSKKKNYWVIKYVYKQEKSMIWQEKINFISNYKLTHILQKKLPELVNLKENRDLFELGNSSETPKMKKVAVRNKN